MKSYIYTYGGYVLIAALAVLFFAILIYIVRLGGVRMREISGVKYHPLKGKRKLYIITAAYLAVSLILMCVGIPLSCSATLSFNYDGASSGLNPNKTRFNQADVLGSEVLERMVDKKILPNVTAEDLRDVMYISTEDTVKKADKTSNTEKDVYRVSSEYKIEYTANKNTAHIDGEKVLKLFEGAYREWFSEQYSTNLTPLEIDFSKFNDYDYLDICDHLDTEAGRISNFMAVMSMNTRSFKSEETGEGFSSIETRVGYIRDTLIANLRAYILGNSLSKDTQTYLGRLSTENIFLNFDARKERMTNLNWLAAIKKYEDDMARIVLVPTYDDLGQFYMSQTKIGVDEFAEEAESSADKMTQLHAQISNNNYVAAQLSAGRGSEAAASWADQNILQIEGELSAAAERARALINEYDADQANGYLTVNVSSWESRAMSAVERALVMSVIFFVLLHIISFLSEVKKKRIAESGKAA